MKSLDWVNRADSWKSEGLDFYYLIANIAYTLCGLRDCYCFLVYVLDEVMQVDLTTNVDHQC